MKLKISAILAFVVFVLALGSTAAACNCGGGDNFLQSFDISSFTVSDSNDENIFVGYASFKAKVATDGGFSLNYRVHIPMCEENEKVPVLLFLHGAGERGSDNRRQLSYEGLKALTASKSKLIDALIIAPQCPSDNMWVNFSDPSGGQTQKNGKYRLDDMPISQSMTAVFKLLKYYDANFDIDRSRIYVMGMSMGGYGTWDMIMRHPEIFAAAAPICGGADPSKAALLKDMPIYTFHGALDPLISPEGTRDMVKALKDAGNNDVTYVEYDDGYHDIWNRAMKTEGFVKWLTSKKKA